MATVTTAPSSLFKKRAPKTSQRKRPATPPPADDSDSSGYSSVSDGEGRRIKRRKQTTAVAAASTQNAGPAGQSRSSDLAASTFAADKSASIVDVNDATKQSNWFDEKDAKHLLGSIRPKPYPKDTIPTDTNAGTYKGAAAYQSYIAKNPNAPSKVVGPVKAPTNIRTITVTDYAPDVCKDYKQTGFCGFGDSCKYLHAREAYKQGWELDKDWDVTGKDKKANKQQQQDAMDSDEEEDALLENIPFACIICKKPYTNPIITKCGHYFCEACALQRYRKSPTCAACGAGTNGVFNGAKQLKKLLERKRERVKKKRELALENGEEVDEPEGDDVDE